MKTQTIIRIDDSSPESIDKHGVGWSCVSETVRVVEVIHQEGKGLYKITLEDI